MEILGSNFHTEIQR